MIKLLIIISVLYTSSYSLTCEYGTGFKYCYDDNFKNKIEQRNTFINKKFLKKFLIKIQNNKEIKIDEKLTQKYHEILLEILPQYRLSFQKNSDDFIQTYVPPLWTYKVINEKIATELSEYGKKIFPKIIDSKIANNIFNGASVYKVVELSIIKNLTETLLFSEEELFQKKVYIEDNINKPYSDALGNIYFPKNINKFTSKEQYLIMLHEGMHYFYTNLFLTNTIIEKNFNDFILKANNKGMEYQKTGNLDFSITDEILVDFYSLNFLSLKNMNLKSYYQVIQHGDKNNFRQEHIKLLISCFSNTYSFKALSEAYYWYLTSQSVLSLNPNPDTSFSYVSIRPLNLVYDKYQLKIEEQRLIWQWLNLISSATLKEKENKDIINQYFNGVER